MVNTRSVPRIDCRTPKIFPKYIPNYNNKIQIYQNHSKSFRNYQTFVQIPTQIKQNMILDCFCGSWGAGSAKGDPHPLEGLHLLVLCLLTSAFGAFVPLRRFPPSLLWCIGALVVLADRIHNKPFRCLRFLGQCMFAPSLFGASVP